MGPTSGISFLNRAWQRLRRHRGSITASALPGAENTYMSTFETYRGPVTIPTSTPYALPSWAEAINLVARYFDFAVPTYRFLHRGTIHNWLMEMYQQSNENTRTVPGHDAIIFMIFATSSLYNIDMEGKTVDRGQGLYEQRYSFKL